MVTRVSRDDLEAEGFDSKDIPDETMKMIAREMGDVITQMDFWAALIHACNKFNINRKI